MSPADPPRLILVVDLVRSPDDDAWLRAVVSAHSAAHPAVLVRAGAAPLERARRWVHALSGSLPAGADLRISARSAPVVEEALDRGWGLHRAAADPARGRPVALHGALGRSAHDEAEIGVAVDEGADAIVAGTIWTTGSKPGRAGIGPGGLSRLVVRAAGIPVYAIGGVDAVRAVDARRAGAWGAAVCGAILEVVDPAGAAGALRAALRDPRP